MQISTNCSICGHCFVEVGVRIGNNVTLKSGIFLCKNVTLEDNVLLSVSEVFVNNLRPLGKQRDAELVKTEDGYSASIRGNSIILACVRIRRFTMTGIAAVITRFVPDYAPTW